MPRLSYSRAVALALGEAMEGDDRVLVFGEDVALGGAYGASRGLRDRFGHERVRDTPISESAIVGFALGMALAGLRPVAEIMHMDFIACAMDQVVNQTAKVRYMFGGATPVPLVIRCGVGGWLSAAAQHSQSLEAWFTHIPGLKVATAGTPRDIRNLLHAAIRDENPVIVMEPLSLYEGRDEVPDQPENLTLGRADLKREGKDVTIVTWGSMVTRVIEASEKLAAEGVEAEVIDLISLHPWDEETVVSSVRRTRRAVVVHQAHRRSGFGAEVAQTVTEQAFHELEAPIRRVAGLDVPVPFSPPLEEYVLPSTERVVDAVHALG